MARMDISPRPSELRISRYRKAPPVASEGRQQEAGRELKTRAARDEKDAEDVTGKVTT